MNKEISNQIVKLFAINNESLFTTLLLNLYDEYKNIDNIPDLEFEQLSNSNNKIWAKFMSKFLEIFSINQQNVVYILMGKESQKMKEHIKLGVFIETAHPSPLARGAFFGSKPFSKANIELKKLGKQEIDWAKL